MGHHYINILYSYSYEISFTGFKCTDFSFSPIKPHYTQVHCIFLCTQRAGLNHFPAKYNYIFGLSSRQDLTSQQCTEYPCFPFGFWPYNEHESSAVGVYVVSDPLGGC